MKGEIESYLREHGKRYTRDALRQQLINAGHGPEEVDAALREWEVPGAAETTGPNLRGRLWLWAWGLHIAAWLLLAAWVLLLAGDRFRYGEGGFGLGILAVALLIGLGISGLIGRAMVNRTGLGAAVAVPAISALLLAGSCLGILGGFGA